MTFSFIRLFAAAGLALSALIASPALAGDREALLKIERDAFEAMVKKDVKALDAMLAEDWTELDATGAMLTKDGFLRLIASSDYQAASITPGPMTIRIYGRTAVVQGSDDEKSSYKGQDTSGHYAWMDMLEKRKGRWVYVASQTARVGN